MCDFPWTTFFCKLLVNACSVLSYDSVLDVISESQTTDKNWFLELVCVPPRDRSSPVSKPFALKEPNVFAPGKGLCWLLRTCRRARGTECSFMHRSHKQIANYATKPLECSPFCFLSRGALSHTLGSSGREWKGPLLEAHQMQKLGHSVPEGSQAPATIRDRTRAFWGHTAKASADFKEWCMGIRTSVRWPSDRKELSTFVIISLYILLVSLAGLRVFWGNMGMIL